MRRKTVKLLALFMAALMMVMLACACGDDETSSEPEDITSDITADNSVVDASSDDGPSDTDSSDVTTSASKNTSSKVTTSKQNTSSKANTTSTQKTSSTKTTTSDSTGQKVTLYVKNFGAKGDGKTDDGPAIFKAINALRSSPSGSVLEFEKGKTYYYETNETKSGSKFILPYLFYFSGDSDLTVKGNGCLVKMGGYDTTYMHMEDCSNITIRDFNLDYAVKPAFAATLKSVDASTGIAVVQADRDITLKNGDVYTPPRRDIFGWIPAPTKGYHLYIYKYEMIDEASHTVRVYFNKTVGQAAMNLADTSLIEQYGLTLPMPHMGFSEASATTDLSFSMIYCKDITMQNINVYSNKYQTFYPKGCEGTIMFDNVNFVRAPYDQKLYFISWGDLFHPANCRAKLVWKNCTYEEPYDDVINVVGGALYVSVKNSNSDITLSTVDNWLDVPKVKVGDEITIINTSTKALIGTAKVKRVVKQNLKDVRVILDKALTSVTTGTKILAWDESAVCDPASEVTNCDMDGTFRFRANMTFNNCKIHVRSFWMGLEAPQEGPLPRDITFKNCQFNCDEGQVFLVQSFNNSNKNGYYIKNIVFENCTGVSQNDIKKDKFDEVTINGTLFK